MMSSVSSGVSIRFGMVACGVCRKARRLSAVVPGCSATSNNDGPTPGSTHLTFRREVALRADLARQLGPGRRVAGQVLSSRAAARQPYRADQPSDAPHPNHPLRDSEPMVPRPARAVDK